MKNTLWLGLFCIAVSFSLDQLTKLTVLNFANTLGAGVKVFPFVNLVLGHNSGVSFGLLNSVPSWGLVLLSLLIIGCLVSWLWQSTSSLTVCALGLVIGGALGNLIDRLRHGAVTDFLDFHVGEYHWPAFNMADTAIVCGVGIILVTTLFDQRKGEKNE
jgi:signal peptidase II